MPFGKKKTASAVQFDQSNVAMLASKALAERRNTFVRLALRVTGETPILMHRWSQKAIMQMVGKMVGQPVPRQSKDLTAEYEDSYFRNTNGVVVVPCRILKAAIVNGAITTQGVTSKAELKRDLRVLGYTAPVTQAGGKMKMDCRIASNSGTPDMRSRAVIPAGYFFDVVLQFPTSLTPDKVIASFEGAGMSIGLCDWRPEKGGDYGTFSIKVLPDREIERILKACSLPEDEFVLPPEFLRAFHTAAGASGASDQVKKASAVVRQNAADNAEARGARGRPRANPLPELAPPPVKRGPGRPRKDAVANGASA